MPKFKYVAVDPSGATVRGVLDAPSAVRARNELLGRDLVVRDVKERKRFTEIEVTTKKIKPPDLMIFSRQMASFLRAGIPILDSIEMLQEDASSPQLRKVLVEVADALRAGSTFADAIAVHRALFPSYYIGILRSAELSGNLDSVLDQLSRYVERDLESTRALKSALTYPAVIFGMSIVTVLVLVIYVLPKFRDFFDSFEARLPLPTRILMGMADFFAAWGLLLAGALVVFVVMLFLYWRTERGKLGRDRLFLRLPALGKVITFAVVERFCRILGAMLRSGVPVPEAMAAATEATNNRVYWRGLTGVRESILRGEGISRPITDTQLFPPAAAKMLRVGEESGTLDQQLEAAAQYSESERAYRLKKLTSLFEPAVIVFMGLIVGFVAIALVSALYGIFDQVNID